MARSLETPGTFTPHQEGNLEQIPHPPRVGSFVTEIGCKGNSGKDEIQILVDNIFDEILLPGTLWPCPHTPGHGGQRLEGVISVLFIP
jgi:hypothetical protein